MHAGIRSLCNTAADLGNRLQKPLQLFLLIAFAHQVKLFRLLQAFLVEGAPVVTPGRDCFWSTHACTYVPISNMSEELHNKHIVWDKKVYGMRGDSFLARNVTEHDEGI